MIGRTPKANEKTMSELPAEEIGVDPGDAVEAAAAARPSGKFVTWSACVAIACAFLVADFVAPQLPYRIWQWLEAVLVGLCIAQVNLIAVWAALAPGNIVLRISWSFLLGMTMWYALLLGGRAYTFCDRSDAIVLGAVLLAALAILQFPLWVAKKVFRWRLTRGAEDAEQFLLEDRQFHLQHLFVATFLVAVAMSPLRSVLPPGTNDGFHLRHVTVVILGAAVLCNLAVTIPCIWWAFSSTKTVVRLFLWWPLYCAALTAVEFGGLCAILGSAWSHAMEDGLVLFVINLSQCGAVFGTLLVFRAIGFRLVRMPTAACALHAPREA
jgi:hypothetical protein